MEISPTEEVKLNVDVIVTNKFTTLVVVARDEKGEVIFAWARQHVFCDLVQIEATTILWALQEMLKLVLHALKSSI
mgnify:CR=1 FL=1